MRSLTILAAAAMLAACTTTSRAPSPVVDAPRTSPTSAELYVQRVPVEFPSAAKKAGETGYVIATFGLDGSGRALDIQIIESRPSGLFDEAAIDALQASEFKQNVRAAGCRYVADFGSGRKP